MEACPPLYSVRRLSASWTKHSPFITGRGSLLVKSLVLPCLPLRAGLSLPTYFPYIPHAPSSGSSLHRRAGCMSWSWTIAEFTECIGRVQEATWLMWVRHIPEAGRGSVGCEQNQLKLVYRLRRFRCAVGQAFALI